MKYRVHIKWQCIAETDAESEQDAINYVLHSALKPKLAETKAVPMVNGRSWMKATAECAQSLSDSVDSLDGAISAMEDAVS